MVCHKTSFDYRSQWLEKQHQTQSIGLAVADTREHRLGELVTVGDSDLSRVFDSVERKFAALTVESGGVNVENIQRIQTGSGLGELAFRPLVHFGGSTQRCAFPVLADYRCGRQREATCLTVL